MLIFIFKLSNFCDTPKNFEALCTDILALNKIYKNDHCDQFFTQHLFEYLRLVKEEEEKRANC